MTISLYCYRLCRDAALRPRSNATVARTVRLISRVSVSSYAWCLRIKPERGSGEKRGAEKTQNHAQASPAFGTCGRAQTVARPPAIPQPGRAPRVPAFAQAGRSVPLPMSAAPWSADHNHLCRGESQSRRGASRGLHPQATAFHNAHPRPVEKAAHKARSSFEVCEQPLHLIAR